MSRIKISKFGPIKDGYTENEGWLDINKVTVFIGNQGSGKSTVAKAISTFTWIEKALVRGDFKAKNFGIKRLKENLAYQNIDGYLKPETSIEYEGDAYRIAYIHGKTQVEKLKSDIYTFPKVMYIPSERNFTSSVRNVYDLKGLPQTLYTFSDEFRLAKEELGLTIVKLPIGDVKFEYRKSGNATMLLGDDYEVEISKSSSGFQSFVPMYIVSRYLTHRIGKENDPHRNEITISERQRIKEEISKIYSNPKYSDEVKNILIEELSRRIKYGCFINIVEEPEQNLYPLSQKAMLYSLIEFANQNDENKLILTTHSPYIINYLSLAVEADSVKEKIIAKGYAAKLKAILPLQSTLAGNLLVIYELDEKTGTIRKLGDYKGLPSDDNYLNQQMALTNDLFSELLDLESLCR